MRLCDREIEEALRSGWLTITPTPASHRINGATVDVTLGNEFRVFCNHSQPYLDLSMPSEALARALETVVSPSLIIGPQALFFLHPGTLALGVMHETIALPDNMVGWLDGRSSLARLGLMVHMTAHRLDPGWTGKIVLEFYNAGPMPLGLKPGMAIGAVSFEQLSGPAERPYACRPSAKYKDQRGPDRSRLDQEYEVIPPQVR